MEKIVDETDAPDGYIAVRSDDGDCYGCAFEMHMTCHMYSCSSKERADREVVIFVEKPKDDDVGKN